MEFNTGITWKRGNLFKSLMKRSSFLGNYGNLVTPTEILQRAELRLSAIEYLPHCQSHKMIFSIVVEEKSLSFIKKWTRAPNGGPAGI